MLAATAAAQRAGKLGAGQVAVIRRFYHQLPGWIDDATRQQAEAHLAKLGTQFRPEQLGGLADTVADCLNPDGNYTDEDRARRRGLTLGKQQPDRMSELRGWITPELRATLEAVLAKLAAPGMCNPGDDTPCVDGTPGQEAIDGDTRSAAQRQHDGLLAALRAMLASGKLGQHNGLPASIIVTTTLAELEAAAGKGLTGGGTMPAHERRDPPGPPCPPLFGDLRQGQGRCAVPHQAAGVARPANHVVRQGTWLFGTRLRREGLLQRGPSRHGLLQVPHDRCQRPDLRLGPTNHKILEKGWITRKNSNGDTEWIPPPHLDRGQPRINTFHHPEKLLRAWDDDDEW